LWQTWIAADVEIPDWFGNAFEAGCFVDENFAQVFRKIRTDFRALDNFTVSIIDALHH